MIELRHIKVKKESKSMDRLNSYKKTQIILIVAIIIALIVFIISFTKRNNVNKRITEPTVSEITSSIEQNENNLNENTLNETQENLEENIEENPEDTSWDENAEDTKVENPEEEEKNSKESYFIKVNYTANVVTIYKKDKQGNFTVPVKAMVCSTGTATPKSGTYKMSNKYRWHQLNGGVYGQYCSRITGHILFHSVPYKTNSPDTLKYTAYDKLGTTASAGCIRLTVADALWIYNNCESGTYVEFYSSSDPGPLGKPSAQKISSNATCRNWDPTDPLASNPWKNYVEPASTTVVDNSKKKDDKKEDNKTEDTKKNTDPTPQPPKKDEDSAKNNTVNNTVNNNTTNNTSKNNTTQNNTTKNNTSNTNNTDSSEKDNTTNQDVTPRDVIE